MPDSLVELEGFSCVRADRMDSSMKSRGGGICVYVNNNWCNQVTVRGTICDPNLEVLCLSMRPFYLPREFGNIILCATYMLYLRVVLEERAENIYPEIRLRV